MRRLALLTAALAACVLFAFGCGDDDPASPQPQKANIAILDDDSTQVDMTTILRAAGYTVTQLGNYWDYAGTDFSAYDLVFLLDGYDYGYAIADSVQQALLDFVTAGGVLVTTEWATYSDEWNLLIPALPLAYDGDYCDDGDSACIDTVTIDVAHTLTAGLPASFATPPDWTYSFCVENSASTSTNILTLMTGQTSGPSLAMGDYGSGHILHWNMAGTYEGENIWDTNTKRVLTNIADFAR